MDLLLPAAVGLAVVAVGGAVLWRLVGARIARAREAVEGAVERRLAEARAAAPAAPPPAPPPPAPVAAPAPAGPVAPRVEAVAMDPAVWVRLDALESRLASLEVQVSSLRTGAGASERPAPAPLPVPPVPTAIRGRGPHPSFP